MYKIYRFEKLEKIDTGVAYELERDSIGSAINMLASKLNEYQAGSTKRAKIDCVFYDGMFVVRLIDARDTFIYRLAVIHEA